MSAPAKYARTEGIKIHHQDKGMGERGQARYDILSGNEPKRTFPTLEALELKLKAIDDEFRNMIVGEKIAVEKDATQ